MRNRCLLGAAVALAMAFGGAHSYAQMFGPYPTGAFYLGPEGGWTHPDESKIPVSRSKTLRDISSATR